MTRYPTLSALLSGELGTRAPSPPQVRELAGKIRREHPRASHVVYFAHGTRWILLPVGHGCKVKSVKQAARLTLAPKRKPLAYCKL